MAIRLRSDNPVGCGGIVYVPVDGVVEIPDELAALAEFLRQSHGLELAPERPKQRKRGE